MIPRPELQRFTDCMEGVLRRNDHKGGWHHEEVKYLFDHLMSEIEELREAIETGCPDRIRYECCDVGNLAMMIFNTHEGLRCQRIV